MCLCIVWVGVAGPILPDGDLQIIDTGSESNISYRFENDSKPLSRKTLFEFENLCLNMDRRGGECKEGCGCGTSDWEPVQRAKEGDKPGPIDMLVIICVLEHGGCLVDCAGVRSQLRDVTGKKDVLRAVSDQLSVQ
jgi:hypothetical protein